MMLSDSALALSEAMGLNPDEGGDSTGTCHLLTDGGYSFAKQLVQVMSDIASEFGEQPEQCAAITLFAVAGMVSDMYAIAADAGLCDVADVPPHPMRAVPQMIDTPLNRAQRRQMGRDLQHRTPLIVPPGFKARGAT